jgi:hypothetical protein
LLQAELERLFRQLQRHLVSLLTHFHYTGTQEDLLRVSSRHSCAFSHEKMLNSIFLEM